jgi:hypothetical protein
MQNFTGRSAQRIATNSHIAAVPLVVPLVVAVVVVVLIIVSAVWST